MRSVGVCGCVCWGCVWGGCVGVCVRVFGCWLLGRFVCLLVGVCESVCGEFVRVCGVFVCWLLGRFVCLFNCLFVCLFYYFSVWRFFNVWKVTERVSGHTYATEVRLWLYNLYLHFLTRWSSMEIKEFKRRNRVSVNPCIRYVMSGLDPVVQTWW